MRAPAVDDGFRAAMEGAVANDPGGAVIQVEDRGEGIIDATGPQFGGQDVADGLGGLPRCGGIIVPQAAEGGHGWQAREAFAEALHPAPFMIHRDKQARFPQGMDFRGQALQLFDVGVVTVNRMMPPTRGGRGAPDPGR